MDQIAYIFAIKVSTLIYRCVRNIGFCKPKKKKTKKNYSFNVLCGKVLEFLCQLPILRGLMKLDLTFENPSFFLPFACDNAHHKSIV